MKSKWGKRRFTFMIIPEANRSVVRFKIPAVILYIIPIAVLLMLTTTFAVYIVHMKSAFVTKQLKSELEHNKDQYKETVGDKNKTITELQNDVITLSQQAHEVKAKIEELKKLENDIKGIQGSDRPAAKSKPVSVVNPDSVDLGIGGTLIPVDQEEIDQLIRNTKKSFTSSFGQTDGLYEALTDAKKQVLAEQYLLRVTPSLWPTISLRVTSIFGYRKDPFTRRPSFHAGVDIAGNSGDPIYVTADGTVQYAGRDSAHGNNIIVKHANGLRTRYMHLKKILAAEGDKVLRGEKIGLLGSTGRSTGPHLHYEVSQNGEAVDPRPYMQLTGKDEIQHVQEEESQD
ncbi:MAG TPA: peptidoglycan DD-metalloendopeptidase family protein [Bacilli bacterium]